MKNLQKKITIDSMQVTNSLHSLFNQQQQSDIFINKVTSSQTIDVIFNFLHSIVKTPQLDEELVDQYHMVKKLTGEDQELSFMKLYTTYEEFLTQNRPPKITKDYTAVLLRQELGATIKISELGDLFILLFLSDIETIHVLFVYSLTIMKTKISSSLINDNQLQNILTKSAQDTMFMGIYFDSQIPKLPEKLQTQIQTIPLTEFLISCNNLYETLYVELKPLLGEKEAMKVFVAIYTFFKQIYPLDITARLLDILPKAAIFNQKLEVASRQEFKRILQRKNIELEEVKKQLDEQVLKLQTQTQILEDTKKAMVNLLEDNEEEKNKTVTEKARDDAILENIGDGLIATDKKGVIILINTSAQNLLGWNSQEVVGKSFGETIPIVYEDNNPIPSEKHPITIALTQGQRIMTSALSKDTLYYIKKDKSKFAVIMTATPVLINNEIVGSISIFRDATNEKQIDRMKTEFISLASHQLRTPLSAIRWFSEMLMGGDAGKLNNEQLDFAQNIYDSSVRMIDLVNSLLNISRIESGRIIVDPKPTNLRELVESIGKELKLKLTEREQTLVISVHNDLPLINIDPKLIRQVYLNLLTNAIKYTPKGGEISVFISKKDTEVISQVTDNGYGIPKEEQHKMFQKFFRATNIVKVETDGTGLGLYLIKAIVASSQGKIWFESEVGKGTTFWFTLPLAGMKAKQGEVTLDS